ncbi:uncharacterized protein F5891DRAFT_959402, partial [Suillus fuscotomentosus]
RGYPPQPLVPSPTGLAYGPAHVPHLSLGNTQQLYDMVLPTGDNHHPAITRVQQQHNVFRGAHQHSTSDPSALRDAATLALLSNQAVFAQATHGMYPPIHPGLYIPIHTFLRVSLGQSCYSDQGPCGNDSKLRPRVSEVCSPFLSSPYSHTRRPCLF